MYFSVHIKIYQYRRKYIRVFLYLLLLRTLSSASFFHFFITIHLQIGTMKVIPYDVSKILVSKSLCHDDWHVKVMK